MDDLSTLKFIADPNKLVNIMSNFTNEDVRQQLEWDRTHRISRYILVSEFIWDISERKRSDEKQRNIS